MADEITIPILPCKSINDMLSFYQVLGFAVTYQQTRPNTYLVVQRGNIVLHFFSMKGYDPAQSYSTCFVLIPDADGLYKELEGRLRGHFGWLPTAGIPRVTALRNKAGGTRGFNIIDPGGNWIRFGQKIESPEGDEEPIEKESKTKLARALYAAELLADSKGDPDAAATLLDKALREDTTAPVTERVQALIARATLAVALGDPQRAATLLAEMQQITLQADEKIVLADELARAADLGLMLQGG